MKVNELVRKMRMVAADDVCLMAQGARALEALAREVDQLRRLTSGDAREFMQGLVDECSREIVRRRDAESRLAAMAPVVEAALCLRLKSEGSNMWDAAQWDAWDDMQAALATLEAANV